MDEVRVGDLVVVSEGEPLGGPDGRGAVFRRHYLRPGQRLAVEKVERWPGGWVVVSVAGELVGDAPKGARNVQVLQYGVDCERVFCRHAVPVHEGCSVVVKAPRTLMEGVYSHDMPEGSVVEVIGVIESGLTGLGEGHRGRLVVVRAPRNAGLPVLALGLDCEVVFHGL